MTIDVEAAARRLCIADGYDPDDFVLPYIPPVGPKGMYLLQHGVVYEQAWTLYKHLVPVVLEIAGGVHDEAEPELPEIRDIPPLDNWRDRYGLNGQPRVRSTLTPPK